MDDSPVEALRLRLPRYLGGHQDNDLDWLARVDFDIREKTHSLTRNIDRLRDELGLTRL
jgi:hypothetical protein